MIRPAVSAIRCFKAASGNRSNATLKMKKWPTISSELQPVIATVAVSIALIIQALLDNRNRTIAELRATFSRHNGRMGETGRIVDELTCLQTVRQIPIGGSDIRKNNIDLAGQEQ